MTVRSFTRLFFAIAILGIHVSSSSAQPLVTGDLTVYYSFDELEGDTFPDGSGNNLHGLVVGLDDDFGDDLEDITVDTEDKVRGAGSAWFNTEPDLKDDRVAICDPNENLENCELAESLGVIPHEAFSFAAWVKVEETGTDQSIYQSRATGGGFVHTQVQGSGGLRMRLRGDANSDNIVQFNDLPNGEPVEFEDWIHVAGTYDKGPDPDGLGEWALYYNGEEVAGGEANGSVAGLEDLDLVGDWGQGAFIGLVPDFNRQLVGRIDEFYLFSRAITAEEVGVLVGLVEPNPLDVNGDGNVDVNDINELSGADVAAWADGFNTYLGDSNLDGEFNSSDFVAVFSAGKFETGEAANWSEGDWDGDGVFGSGDFVAAFSQGGYEMGPRPEPAQVPEPNTLALLALGFIAVLFRRK